MAEHSQCSRQDAIPPGRDLCPVGETAERDIFTRREPHNIHHRKVREAQAWDGLVPNRDVPSISSYSSFGRVAELVDFPILTNDVDRELVGAVPESKPDLKRVTFSRRLWLLEVVDGIQDAGTGVISVYLCSMMKSTPFVCRRLNAKIW